MGSVEISTRAKLAEAKRWLDTAWDELQAGDPYLYTTKYQRARHLLDAKSQIAASLKRWPKTDDYSQR